MCDKKWSFHVYSDGWRHFLVCISSASERKETCINVQPFLGHPVSENYGELVSNIEEQLRIVFMYTGNLFLLHDLAIWKWLKKCVHLKCICVWCMDRAPEKFQIQRVIVPYFWKWCVFAYFLCTVVLSTSEKIAYMYTFKIMFDTSVIQ